MENSGTALVIGSVGTGLSLFTIDLNAVASFLAGMSTAIYMSIMIYKALQKKNK